MATIAELTAKIERIGERLECWATKPQTEKRIAKIERQEARREWLYAQITAIEEREAAAIERAEPLIDEVTGVELPKDSFTFRVEQTDWGVSVFVDIYDSPFDDTFTGGEPLVLRTGATGKQTANGTQSQLLHGVPGQWRILDRRVLQPNGHGWSRACWSDWPEFSHLALTLAKDDKQWINGGGFNYVLETADLTTAEIFV